MITQDNHCQDIDAPNVTSPPRSMSKMQALGSGNAKEAPSENKGTGMFLLDLGSKSHLLRA